MELFVCDLFPPRNKWWIITNETVFELYVSNIYPPALVGGVKYLVLFFYQLFPNL